MRSLLPLVLLCGALSAQSRTFVVAPSPGNGVDFVDIPPAVAAAAPGDLIVVRAGTYSGFTVREGIRILGEGAICGSVEVRSIPVSEQCSLTGLTIDGDSQSGSFTVADCVGPVLIQDVRLTVDWPPSGLPFQGLRVLRSASVGLTNCDATGSPALSVVDSTVSVAGSTLRGLSSFVQRGSVATPNYAGVEATRARFVVAASRILGGGGATSQFTSYPGRPGFVAVDSHVSIAAGGVAEVLAGSPGAPGAVPALDVDGGTLVLDPGVTLRSYGSPDVVGSAIRDLRALPSLQISGGERGGMMRIDVASPQAGPFVLMVGAKVSAMELSPLGLSFLDRSTAFDVLSIYPPTDSVALTFPVPQDPRLQGISMAFQVLQVQDRHLPQPRVRFSNLAVGVVR